MAIHIHIHRRRRRTKDAKWRVYLASRTKGPGKNFEVEANSEEEAIREARKRWGSGTSFKVDAGRGAEKIGDAERGLGRGLSVLHREIAGERRMRGGPLIDLPASEWSSSRSSGPEYTPPAPKVSWRVELQHRASPQYKEYYDVRARSKEEAERDALAHNPEYRVVLTRRTGE